MVLPWRCNMQTKSAFLWWRFLFSILPMPYLTNTFGHPLYNGFNHYFLNTESNCHIKKVMDFFYLFFFLFVCLFLFSFFLVHLDQRSRWTIAITWRPSSVNFSHFKLLLRNHLADWNWT
jgi:hypothetical protein